MQNIENIIQEFPDKALNMLRKIKVNKSDKKNTYIQYLLMAKAFYYNAKYSKAIKYYEKILNKNYCDSKDLVDIYLNLGDCYFEKDRFREAIKIYQKVLKLEASLGLTDSAKIYDSLALNYLNIKKYKDAIFYYEKITNLLNFSDDEFKNYLYCGAISRLLTCYWKLGDDKKAEEYFDKVLKLRNVSTSILASTYANNGHRLFEKKNWSAALRNYVLAMDNYETEESKDFLQTYVDVCRRNIEKSFD